jgi:hypothetical protein
MIVVPNYRGFRIEITAQLVDGAWDAGILIRCLLSNEVRRTKYVACHKPTPEEAEHSADLWARRWMDGIARLARLIPPSQSRRHDNAATSSEQYGRHSMA